MQNQLKIAIIGTGFGKVIAQNFRAIDPSIEISMSGRTPAKLEKIAEEIRDVKTFLDWQEMLKSQKFDLIIIASVSSAHKEMFDFALQFDTPILIEKPAALNSKELCEMIASASKKKQRVVVNHEARFSPVVAYLKVLIAERKFGKILTIRSNAYLNWYSREDYKENWNQKLELGGGQVYSVGTHQLDLVNYLLGTPFITTGCLNKIAYQDSRFEEPATSDSQFSATFVTSDEVSIQLANDTYCQGYKDFTLEIIGTKGIALYSDQKGLWVSYSNNQPLEQIKIEDTMPEITLGNSLISRSMKYMVKAIIAGIKNNDFDDKFCQLSDEFKVIETFEKFS